MPRLPPFIFLEPPNDTPQLHPPFCEPKGFKKGVPCPLTRGPVLGIVGFIPFGFKKGVPPPTRALDEKTSGIGIGNGATISLSGASGGAKSGALFSALSAWGNPEGLYFHTNSGMTGNNFRGRMLAMHNIPLGIDEVTNKQPDILSELIHLVSAGKPKGRMYGSINAERPTEASSNSSTAT